MAASKTRDILFSTILLVISTAVAFAAGELFLRLKNSSMKNYDIEMWRYALELKTRSDIPILGHEHVPGRSATLQSVDIRINRDGLRGPDIEPPVPGKRRILFLGSSVTLGWGVDEEETLTARIRKMFQADGQNVDVLNAGIGNYNSLRYVTRYMQRLSHLQPTDIVVHYFLRDAETLDAGGGNFLLRHSQLAVTVWVALTRYFSRAGEVSLETHYREVYRPDASGFRAMRDALHELGMHARQRGIRIYLAMTPDVHDLVEYKFGFAHEIMRKVAAEEGFVFVDLLPSMLNLTPKDVWSMPGDPHPNSLGHKRMAEALYPVLRTRESGAQGAEAGTSHR